MPSWELNYLSQFVLAPSLVTLERPGHSHSSVAFMVKGRKQKALLFLGLPHGHDDCTPYLASAPNLGGWVPGFTLAVSALWLEPGLMLLICDFRLQSSPSSYTNSCAVSFSFVFWFLVIFPFLLDLCCDLHVDTQSSYCQPELIYWETEVKKVKVAGLTWSDNTETLSSF